MWFSERRHVCEGPHHVPRGCFGDRAGAGAPGDRRPQMFTGTRPGCDGSACHSWVTVASKCPSSCLAERLARRGGTGRARQVRSVWTQETLSPRAGPQRGPLLTRRGFVTLPVRTPRLCNGLRDLSQTRHWGALAVTPRSPVPQARAGWTSQSPAAAHM